MPDFPYYPPHDPSYHLSVDQAPNPVPLEKPIIPIYELGETVPESDPQGRNLLQTTQAAIRGGAGTLQIVMTTSHESAIGGRFKAMGTEVREALREIALANKVMIRGVELPTSLKNLSGFDFQQSVFSEDARRRGFEEVKDAIKFTADVSGGGGVDIVSWEFPRNVNDANWQEKGPDGQPLFVRDSEIERLAWLVDDRTGRTTRLPKDEKIRIAWNKDGFTPIAPEDTTTPVEKRDFEWSDFERWAKENRERLKKLSEEERAKLEQEDPVNAKTTPEEIFVATQLQGQVNQLRGQISRYKSLADQDLAQVKAFEEREKEERQAGNEEEAKKFAERKQKALELYKDYMASVRGSEQSIHEIQQRIAHFKPINEYGLKRSAETYAEAGILAMQQTKEGQAKGTVKTPIHVGPEIGWPDYYGSHPKEFVELIDQSRKKMVELLTKREIEDARTGQKQANPYFNPNVSESEAKKLAADHVKGLFDTSHMGMWLAHFRPIVDKKTGTIESEEARIKRFNEWFNKQVDTLAEETKKRGIIGGIQLVDSASAAHGHLPPGQGIFPVIEAAKKFKAAGYSGFLVSEGHEEEKFGQGRIRTKLWQNAGAPIGNSYYNSAPPLQWRQVQHNYFGKTYNPLFMFGSYSPSNDFKLWSEVPLE
ncbi:hypothetical protein C4580_02265 [Candidatus Woesearchaeota archaeon]|nr:MAG: hypothetical protein C4580_02265 [Candidatus Woesearchaeota archaeon]